MRLKLPSRNFMQAAGERLNNIQPSKSGNVNELPELNPLGSFPSQDKTQTKFMKSDSSAVGGSGVWQVHDTCIITLAGLSLRVH